MLSRHRVSRAAIELIKQFEGYRRQAAQLPDGRWTIGHGHTLTAREGAQVSPADAEALLVYDLIGVQHAVNEALLAPLSRNQFDALVSFAFNIGTDAFRQSRVLKRINAGETLSAACEMMLWRKAEFEGEVIVVDALVRRRAAEAALFLTPEGDAWTAAPSPMVRPRRDDGAADVVLSERPTTLTEIEEAGRVALKRAVLDGPPAPALAAKAEATAAKLQTLFPEQEPATPPAFAPLPDPEPPRRGPAQEEPSTLDIPQAPNVNLEVGSVDFIPARRKPAARRKEGSLALDIALALLGLVFFGFGLFWLLNASTPGLVAGTAGLAGALFLSVAVYRLLQRLGRAAERD